MASLRRPKAAACAIPKESLFVATYYAADKAAIFSLRSSIAMGDAVFCCSLLRRDPRSNRRRLYETYIFTNYITT